MNIKRIVLWVIAWGLSIQSSQGQGQRFVYGNEELIGLDELLSTSPSDRDEDELRDLVDLGGNYTRFALLTDRRKAYADFLRAIEDARMDKQAGASASSEGSTSLVSKGVVPRVLAFAVENGALARTTDGTIATFRGNALGVARALAGAEQFPYCAVHDPRCRGLDRQFLEGLSFSASFDASRTQENMMGMANPGGQNENILLANTRQISGWGVRYDAPVRRSNFNEVFIEKWEEKIQDQNLVGKANALTVELIKAFEKLQASDEYDAWLRKTVGKLKLDSATTESDVREILRGAGAELVEIGRSLDPEFDAKIQSVLSTFASYFGTRDRVLSEAVNRLTYAFEFANSRPLNQPSQSTFRSIVSGRPTEQWLITFNGAFTLYDSLPDGAQMGRWRDAQLAFQVDRRLGRLGSSVNTDLSGGYYYQFMAEDALLNIPMGSLAPGTAIPLPGDASVLLNTKGHIHIGQVKLTFSVKNTGIKIPIAFTVANRTELIKASVVRANFGITFDLDNLFASKQ